MGGWKTQKYGTNFIELKRNWNWSLKSWLTTYAMVYLFCISLMCTGTNNSHLTMLFLSYSFFADEITSSSTDPLHCIINIDGSISHFLEQEIFGSVWNPSNDFCYWSMVQHIKPTFTNEFSPQQQLVHWQSGHFTRSKFLLCWSYLALIITFQEALIKTKNLKFLYWQLL